MDTLTLLQEIDQATLAPLVHNALGNDALPIGWHVAPFGRGAGQNVYRFQGQAQVQGDTLPWSLIVKVLRGNESNDPSSAHYWKREALVYQSGLLANLPAGLAAPRCFGIPERPDGDCWLWLEEVRDSEPEGWKNAQYVAVARQIGRFGGAYLAGWPFPVQPWLSCGWYRSFAETAGQAAAQLPTLLNHPFIQDGMPGNMAARVLHFWDERELYYDVLEQLPQTFCHLDFNSRNLLLHNAGSGRPQLVAIDWAFVGVNALGADLATMVGSPLLFREIEPAAAAALEEIVLVAYLDGLRDVGWQGDAQQLRLGYACALSLHLIPILLGGTVLGTWNEDFRQFVEAMLGVPYAQTFPGTAAILDFLLARADQARQSMRSL